MSTSPFSPSPRTTFSEMPTTPLSVCTGIAYCSSFAIILPMDNCADNRRISLISRLVTSSLSIIPFITFSATSASCSCAAASPSGLAIASPKSSSTCSFARASCSSFSSLWLPFALSPKIWRNTPFRSFTMASIAMTFVMVFGMSYFCSTV